MKVSIFKRPHRKNYYIRYSKDIGLRTRCLNISDKGKAQYICNQEHEKYILGQYNLHHSLFTPLDISTAMQMFIDTKRTYGRALNTIKSYTLSVNNFLKFLGANILTHAVTENNIDRYINHRRSAGAAQKTIRNELVVLKGFFKYARKKKIIHLNPIEDIPLPKRPHTLKRAFTRAEYQLFKQTINSTTTLSPSPREQGGGITPLPLGGVGGGLHHTGIIYNPALFSAIVDFYILTGIRREDGTLIRISQHLNLQRKLLIIPDAKKDTVTKTVHLHPRLLRIVRQLLQYQQNDHLIPVVKYTLTRWFTHIRNKAGLDHNITFHSLRHTFATWLAESGADPRSIMELLGHTTLEPTLIYMHAVEAKSNKAMRLIKLPQVKTK